MNAQEMIQKYKIGDTVLYDGNVYPVHGYHIDQRGRYLVVSDTGNLLNVENLVRRSGSE